MNKALLLSVLFACLTVVGFTQTDNLWASRSGSGAGLVTDKAVARQSFPKEFKLFELNSSAMKQKLYSVTGKLAKSNSVVISLPNADGELEKFEVFEASNFEPALQARFPEIRAFSGKGVTDRYATLKISISPEGIQTMVFRTDKPNEFIEAYSTAKNVYAVFKSQRQAGRYAWTCSTEEANLVSSLNSTVGLRGNSINSTAGELKTMRLAQSCNAEYSNFFGAFNASQVGLVLAAFNATLTRCNGVYEKDLALHLNLIANSVDVIFYDPATDPYSNSIGPWNNELQNTLTSIIGDASYDIGHMFGASGGGGNAGCIGCVCSPGIKGRGITSPGDGIPQGDNFDIDYVVHEVGHQLGGTHTFSMSIEAGGATNVEVGSGITIMGYAGITNQDVAPHSIDIYHERTIEQIQSNLATKTCPVTTSLAGNNATPVVAPVANYIIPISTPFALTGSATDANPGDALTYCWEQNDNANSSVTGNNSVASPTKTVGPNWISWPATASPVRYFPRLQSILAGNVTTGPLPGGSAIATTEALSSVSRVLNFRLTVRDNSPYVSSGPGIKVGQTAFTDMSVTVTNSSGPFAVTTPNTNVSWDATTTQAVTWSVNGTTAAPVSCANVRILLSVDGGLTFPTVLAASTANDGTELVTIPNTPTTLARIKVESVGNIFFDISNTNFTIAVPPNTFLFSSPAATTIACNAANSAAVTLGTTSVGGYVVPVVLTATAGVPAGSTVTFAPATVVPGGSSIVTLNNTSTLSNDTYNVTITGVSGAITQTRILSFIVSAGTAPTLSVVATKTVCAGSTASFSVAASGAPVNSYQWQVSTNSGTSWANVSSGSGGTTTTYTTGATTTGMNAYQYRVLATGQCGVATSNAATLTVQTAPAITAQPQSVVECAGNSTSFSVTATGSILTYQWEFSTDGVAPYTSIAGATASTYTLNALTIGQNNYRYRVVVSGACPAPVTSNAAILNVGNAAAIAIQPASTTVCVGQTASFNVVATGSSLTYQWLQSIDGGATFTSIAGATAATLNLPATAASQNGYQYKVNVFSCTPTPVTSSAVTLTVNTLAVINTQPSAVVLCEGSAATFTVNAAGTGLSYQWQVSTTGCAGTFANIGGATSNTLTLTNTLAGQSGNAYRVVVTGTCNTITSSCVLLTVNTAIVVTAQPVNTSACLPDQNTASFSVTVTGTAPTYQWQVSTNSGTSWTNISGATNASLTLTGLTASMTGNQYRVVLNGTCTTNLNSSVATLVVNTKVEITTQPVSRSICAGSSTTFNVAATGSTITYQWEVSVNNGPFVPVTNTGSFTGYTGATTATLGIANAPTTISGYKYRVIVSGVPCGAVTSNIATLTVNPLPSAVLVAAPYNRLTPYTNTSLFTTVSPVGTYTYQYKKDGVVLNVPNAASLPVNIDGFGLYEVTVTDVNGCSSTSNKVQISDSASNMVFVYPNPSRGQFQVRYYRSSASDNAYSVIVYDGKGGRVFSKQFPIAAPYSRMDVNLNNAPAGIYMLQVTDAKGKRLASSSVIIAR